ncbi:MAG: class I SAM-dependent methyltransferase [Candidatus Riflebacteria bacterium]|nr:class I SAM-dependent methyltransferase [Candidatus Riflebacteria bacterium]
MKKFRSPQEIEAGRNIEKIFDNCKDTVEIKLENFPKYVRRQHLKRFLALYELFKLALPVKGSVVECGVNRGFGLMAFAKLSTMLEPENLTRRIYGFDTFEGFPTVHEKDSNTVAEPLVGGLKADSFEELNNLIKEYDKDRFLGHLDKVHLVRGDVEETIPKFLQDNPHLIISLLFLDLDLFEPTSVAIKNFLPRVPKGGIIAFDELDNPMWPGETLAALETVGIRNLELRRFEWDPYIAYAII